MSFVLRRFFKYIFYAVAALAALAAGLFAYLTWFQPPFYFPKPTGPYAVGVREFHWIDTTRKDPYSDDSAHPYRELMVSIWYPATGVLSEEPATPYIPYLYAHLRAHFQKDASLFERIASLTHPNQEYSYAVPKAPVTAHETPFPVILFSHGFGTRRDDLTAHCEGLASHGYVVVGVGHTYTSCLVEFPDGRTANSDLCNAKIEKEGFEVVGNEQIETWAADVRFVLDKLEELAGDRESPFYNCLDRENIGMFGHSFGGATAIQVCRHDPRVKAGADLDGMLFGADYAAPVGKPTMFIIAGNSARTMEQPIKAEDFKRFGCKSMEEAESNRARTMPAFKKIAGARPLDSYIFVVDGMSHMDFTDVALLEAGRLFAFLFGGGSGSLNPFRANEIVNAYLVSFFDKYLKGQPSELLDGLYGGKYPEVVTKQWEKK